MNTLLMLSKVNCLGININAILDPCSNLSLITHNVAQKLKLNGREISVTITKVGNTTEMIRTREYLLTLKDVNDCLWRIRRKLLQMLRT